MNAEFSILAELRFEWIDVDSLRQSNGTMKLTVEETLESENIARELEKSQTCS